MKETVHEVDVCTMFEKTNFADCGKAEEKDSVDSNSMFYRCNLGNAGECGFRKKAIIKIQVEE